jgi:NAD(P)-dependent dehydrogenase (short-subunit alcohol dehydrogenase family)
MDIVITGASKGVGYQTAMVMSADRSNRVFALSRSENELKNLRKLTGENLIPIVCDLTKEEEVINAVHEIKKYTDKVEVLINNAGLLIKKKLEELSLEEIKNIYDVNVVGIFSMTKLLLPLLRRGNLSVTNNVRSHVINISSMGGIQGSMKFEGLSAYSSSKGAVITLTECFAEELKVDNIRVNCVALGSVETEMFLKAFPGMKAFSRVKETGEWLSKFSLESYNLFNGKVLQMSVSTP